MLPGRACPSPKHPHLRRPSLWPVRCQPNRPNTISPGWRLRHPCHLNLDVLWEVTRDKNKENGNIFGNWWVLSLNCVLTTQPELDLGMTQNDSSVILWSMWSWRFTQGRLQNPYPKMAGAPSNHNVNPPPGWPLNPHQLSNTNMETPCHSVT